ncbi:unnamed protein product [Hymenolepis diminuta]|uniref:Uncharacterized protein n=1 Tax=Hymenolepis diminuta TaxID=6216 RepID=A0A158QDY4_HYMDI|nr:unnamed protein product [Hymenolepis diminuta]
MHSQSVISQPPPTGVLVDNSLTDFGHPANAQKLCFNEDLLLLDKTRSNPSFGQRLSLSLLPKTSRAASWNNSATALEAFERRRSSGGATTHISNERYGYLSVGGQPGTGSGFLDPRRHSYGCSVTSSANSLLTGGICEGPFSSSPFGSGQNSRRPSAPIFERLTGLTSCRQYYSFSAYHLSR